MIDSYVFDRCGDGGVLAVVDESLIKIKHSAVQKMRQMGLEARKGGKIIAERNVIINNQFHGISIGTSGFGDITSNAIQGNGHEGIYCGGIP